MMKRFIIIAISLFFGGTSYSQSVTATYSSGNISTNFSSYSGACNGPLAPLVVIIPAGANVTSIDVNYTTTAQNNAYSSEQRSQIHCQETGNTEGVFNGTGGAPGVQNYSRTGVNIANGITASGTLTFEMRAWRTWGGSLCDQFYSFINNNSWTITVYYNIPGPVLYSSATTTQTNISSVEDCATSAEIIGVEVVTTGLVPAINATQFTINTTGSSSLAEISVINIYSTGNSATFATGTLFGTAAPGATVAVNGTQVLLPGTNYFWVEYVLNTPMTIGNTFDATCSGLVVNSVAYTPSVVSPAGTRVVGACNPSPGGIAGNLQAWFNANIGTTGSPVTSWANQGSNVNIPVVTSLNGGNLTANALRANYNSVIGLTGDYNGTFHNTVSQRTDLIAGNEVTMYCAYQQKLYPDLSLNFHSSIVAGGIDIIGEWRTWGFRHGGLGSLFSNGTSHLYSAPAQAQMSENSGFVGMHGTESAAGGNNMNGTEMSFASTGTWYSGTSDMELSIGYWPGYGMTREVMEAIVYDVDLDATERNKVETYLALKYGITKGINGTSINYISPSDGSVVWDIAANSGFNFDIAGIARFDVSGLDQRKSHSTNGAAVNSFNDIVTIANGTNFSSPSLLSTDKSQLVWGHNNAALINTGVVVNYPTDNGEIIEEIFQREWKAQEGGTVSTVTLEFDLSGVAGPGGGTGNNDLAAVRLLVDEDGDYSLGATSITPSAFNNVTGVCYFEVDFVAPTGNNLDQLHGYFFTLGTTDAEIAPLPIEMSAFEISSEDCSNLIEWSTASELNNESFIIERSNDMVNWDLVGSVLGAGNSNSTLDYMYRDNAYSTNGVTYYRIVQVDFNGLSKEVGLQVVNSFCVENIAPIAFPNPVNNQLSIKSGLAGTMSVLDLNGRIVLDGIISEGVTSFEMSNIIQGSYLLKIELSNGKSYIDQFVKL